MNPLRSHIPSLKFLRVLLLPLTAAVTMAASAAEPIRILCIGDSITQGGRADRDEYTYRWPLFKMLKDAGVNFDFIGSRQKGLSAEAKWPDVNGVPFDADHEGYYGAKTATVRDHLREVLPTLPPADIVLIHLGTNDQNAEDYPAAVVEPLTDIIAQLRMRNPKVVVLIGHLNFNDGAALKIRPHVETMAAKLNTPGSPVITVHHYKGWNEKAGTPDADTFDWAHPNPQGQRKMAKAWFDAMKPFLPSAASARPN